MNSTLKFEKISKFLIILLIISFLGNYFFTTTLSSFLSLGDIGQYKFHLHILSIAQSLLFFIINIVIGVWLYKKAPSNKWGWMLLALAFGVNAVILFYLNQVASILSARTKD